MSRAPAKTPQTKLRVGAKRWLSTLPLDEVKRLVQEAKASRFNADQSVLDVTTMEGKAAFVSLADCVAAEEWVAE